MNAKDPDVLSRALAKQAEGRGTSNTEKRALSDYARGRIGRDHFTTIPTTPLRELRPDPEREPPERAQRMVKIEEVEGLQAELRRGGRGGSDTAALEARIAVLETLLSGLTRQSVSYCSGGSTATKTILMS